MKKVEYYGKEILIPDDHYFVATDDDGEVCSFEKRPSFGVFSWVGKWEFVTYRDDLARIARDTLVEYPKEGKGK